MSIGKSPFARVPLGEAWVYTLTKTEKVSDLEKIKGKPLVRGDRVFTPDPSITVIPDKPFLADFFALWMPVPLPDLRTEDEKLAEQLTAGGVVTPEMVAVLKPLLDAKIAAAKVTVK